MFDISLLVFNTILLIININKLVINTIFAVLLFIVSNNCRTKFLIISLLFLRNIFVLFAVIRMLRSEKHKKRCIFWQKKAILMKNVLILRTLYIDKYGFFVKKIR